MANEVKKIRIGSTDYSVYDTGAARISHTQDFSTITNRGEEYLSWGGPNQSGNVSPIGMSLSNEHAANRMAFIDGSCITVEYSSDGGSTWTDYGYDSAVKSQFWTQSYGIPVGRASASSEYTTSSRTRMTITAQNGTTGYVYTDPKKMLINISSSGGMQVLIEYRTGTNYKSGGAWTTFGTYSLSGWSGWNDIPLILGTLGGGTTQTGNNWQLRLTFIMTSKSTDYPTTASVNSGRIYGSNNWNTPSNMAATGHLYSFDMSQNVTFPATVNATKFVGPLQGNADTATKATQDGSGNVIASYYARKNIATGGSSAANTGSAGGHSHTVSVPAITMSVTGTTLNLSVSSSSATSSTADGHTHTITHTHNQN